MALYTKSQLREIENSVTLTESRNFSDLPKTKPNSFDIFLCHSYLDGKEVKGLYLDLTRKGYSVYVDWIIDPELDRNNVTKETAELIRKRLRSSKTLLLAFSTNATLSKWVPWELGYVDGRTQNCALVPVADTETESYRRVEYLRLYPILERRERNLSPGTSLFITESANQYVDFKSWIRGDRPTFKMQAI